MNGPRLSNIDFFISSTYIDMKDYRETVIKLLQSKAGIINAQEFFGARNNKPLTTCLDELEKSQVFIMFLGPRYGSIDEASGLSFVECEYNRAFELGMPKFAYIIDENHSFPLKFVSKGNDAVQLARFKTKVQSDLTVSTFTTPDDLAEKLYSDLRRELPKHNFVLGHEPPEREQITTLRVLEQFKLLPKLFHGHTVTFIARLKNMQRATGEECEAFGYDYGAALKRSFEAVDPTLRAGLKTSYSIFAHGEQAGKFSNIASDMDVRLTVKTMQGEYSIREPIYALEREFGASGDLSALFAGRRRVITHFEESTKLICGLEVVDFQES